MKMRQCVATKTLCRWRLNKALAWAAYRRSASPPVAANRCGSVGALTGLTPSVDGGAAVVTDYKTGKYSSSSKVNNDPVAGGRALQLAVYGKAVQRQYPDAAVSSDYWFVTDEPSGYKRTGIDVDQDTNDRVAEVFTAIGDSFANGAFPAVPGEEDGRTSFKNCRSCPYDPVCPRDRAEAWARKSGAEQVRPFVSLTEVAE